MRAPGSHEAALDEFRHGKIDILLGTQMIAKGLDFPNVTLVGVINADTALHLPDFRAAERTFQLVTQVAGRTGRGGRGGRVLVQTFSPDHPAITAAARHDYQRFAEANFLNDNNFPTHRFRIWLESSFAAARRARPRPRPMRWPSGREALRQPAGWLECSGRCRLRSARFEASFAITFWCNATINRCCARLGQAQGQDQNPRSAVDRGHRSSFDVVASSSSFILPP